MEGQHRPFSLEQSTAIVFQSIQNHTEEDVIASKLEQHVSGCIEAVNSRQFDPKAWPWSLMSDNFRMTTNGATVPPSESKAETMEHFAAVTRAYPGYRLQIEAFDTHIYQKARYAKVYVNGCVTGGPNTPSGLSRMAVYVFEHRLVGKEWWLVKQTSIMGVGEC